jgi:hypothetical protein
MQEADFSHIEMRSADADGTTGGTKDYVALSVGKCGCAEDTALCPGSDRPSQGGTLARSDRSPLLVLRNLVFGPRVELVLGKVGGRKCSHKEGPT